MKKGTETDLVRACLDYLKARRIFAWRANTTGVWDPAIKRFRIFGGLKGVADIMAVLPPHGRILCCETKVGRNKLSPHQAAFGAGVQAAGGVYLVCRSVDDLIAALAEVAS